MLHLSQVLNITRGACECVGGPWLVLLHSTPSTLHSDLVLFIETSKHCGAIPDIKITINIHIPHGNRACYICKCSAKDALVENLSSRHFFFINTATLYPGM